MRIAIMILTFLGCPAYMGWAVKSSQSEAFILASFAVAHLLGGAIVTAVAMINFPQAAVLGLGLTLSSIVSRPRASRAESSSTTSASTTGTCLASRLWKSVYLVAACHLASPQGLALAASMLESRLDMTTTVTVWEQLAREWVMFGNWFIPGCFGVWWVLHVVLLTLLWV